MLNLGSANSITQPHVGLLGGYNMQRGQWVFGIEADVEFLGDKQNQINDLPGTPIRDLVKVDWSGHARVRVGRDIAGWLPYLAGGAVLANVKASHTGFISPTDTFTWRQKDVRLGYSLGGGVEKRLNGGWSIRAEYLYDYWSAKHYDWVPGERYSDIALTINTIRVGVTKTFR